MATEFLRSEPRAILRSGDVSPGHLTRRKSLPVQGHFREFQYFRYMESHSCILDGRYLQLAKPVDRSNLKVPTIDVTGACSLQPYRWILFIRILDPPILRT